MVASVPFEGASHFHVGVSWQAEVELHGRHLMAAAYGAASAAVLGGAEQAPSDRLDQ